MGQIEITEQTIVEALGRGDYPLALSGAFSYLDGALGSTKRTNKKRMVAALRDHMPVFTRAMTRGRITINNIELMYSKMTPIEDILYDIRCNIQHDGRVDVVELVEEGRITVAPDRVELPLGVILGLIAVANAVRSADPTDGEK